MSDLVDLHERRLGALRTPPEILAKAWPIRLALAEIPTAAPAKYHTPKCQLGVTISQIPFGACEPFSGAYLQAAQELIDEGRQLLPGVLDPLRTYAEIKGLPWPLTDPSQDPSPGMYSPQLFGYIQRIGWATKDGSPRRKCGPYYALGAPSSSAAFLNVLQQTILQLGPFQFVTDWPNNWWGTDARGFMPTPIAALAGAHAFETCGWEVHPDGSWDSIHHQTWGNFGRDPEFPDHFRARATWWDRLGVGWEAWKVIDVIGDAPRPSPEVGMLPVYSIDQMLVDLPLGTQLYREDGKMPLVRITVVGGAVARVSCGLAYPTQRTVEISTGGVRQWAVVNVADCRNIRPIVADVKHNIALTIDGEVKYGGTL